MSTSFDCAALDAGGVAGDAVPVAVRLAGVETAAGAPALPPVAGPVVVVPVVVPVVAPVVVEWVDWATAGRLKADATSSAAPRPVNFEATKRIRVLLSALSGGEEALTPVQTPGRLRDQDEDQDAPTAIAQVNY